MTAWRYIHPPGHAQAGDFVNTCSWRSGAEHIQEEPRGRTVPAPASESSRQVLQCLAGLGRCVPPALQAPGCFLSLRRVGGELWHLGAASSRGGPSLSSMGLPCFICLFFNLKLGEKVLAPNTLTCVLCGFLHLYRLCANIVAGAVVTKRGSGFLTKALGSAPLVSSHIAVS